MRRALGVMVLGVAVLGAGCDKANKHDRVLKSRTYVLEKGEEPRYMLRYAIPAGSSQTFATYTDLTVQLFGAQETPLVTAPRVVMVDQVDVGTADAKSGAMPLTITLTDVHHEDRPGTNPEGMAAFELMKGMRMTGRLLPSGQSRGVQVDPTSVSALALEGMSEPEEILDQIVAILPDVPVGKGARWRLEETVMQGQIRVQIDTSYELLEVTEGSATIHTVSDVKASEQTTRINGMKLTLEDMTAHGDSTATIDFGMLVDRLRGSLDIDLTLSGNGERLELVETMAMQCLPEDETPDPAPTVAPPPPPEDAP